MTRETCRILIVEDRVDFALLVAKKLRDTRPLFLGGVQLSIEITNNAYYARQALSPLSRGGKLRWDVIISDVYMPHPTDDATSVIREERDGFTCWLHAYDPQEESQHEIDHGAFLIADYLQELRENEVDIGHLKLAVISNQLKTRPARARLNKFMQEQGVWFSYYDKLDFAGDKNDQEKQRFTNEERPFYRALINVIRAYKRVSVSGDTWFPQNESQEVEIRAKNLGLETQVAVVLVEGDVGTGKQTVARMIHEERMHALKAEGVFRSHKEHDLPADLEFSQGSYSGRRTSEIAAAKTLEGAAPSKPVASTLFIKRIHALSDLHQIELLKLIRKVEEFRADSTKAAKQGLPNLIICSTNQDLQAYVEGEMFRNDLYTKLIRNRIATLPLKDRQADIELYLNDALQKHREDDVEFSQEALQWLCNCDWRLNIRQLDDVVADMVRSGLTRELSLEDAKIAYRAHDQRATPPQFGAGADAPELEITPDDLVDGDASFAELKKVYSGKEHYLQRAAIIAAAIDSCEMELDEFASVIGTTGNILGKFVKGVRKKIQAGEASQNQLAELVDERFRANIERFCSAVHNSEGDSEEQEQAV